ncbi:MULTISPECIES: P-type conjugative transfer protein TrbL [Mesorhizobium]|uniref:P-type conjugative transfer protein TrbL n=3 Tax=Phyllobacteriaceae TaxID=69277 RepID=UPI0007A95249|nr:MULTISPECIES: P-type conjugative transfer protein TrbL [Mesorhizobium]AMX97830.1 conjugal transfer protein TrbL [Mesorhizobium ciceri]MDF3233898.1 P-type conjugative transfer protein TrbL [Mesorhizobium sp. DSM 30133]RUU16426.1 P-type conjugative transfer protein TrbL [Mesorhizobium sp. Primo-B]RUU33995.1 P-type conjugative transfer protein TrbL [Mesorhizobium sp. Primo-A]RVB81195.1 P-type conjugative transfer protein TrbL [Mesorhizobium sp. M7A.F.Ca.AU.002.03.1.1]
MNDTGVIDRFLETFTRYIDSGFGLLGGEVAFLTSTLIVIDITLAGLFWAWGADEDMLHRLVKKTLYIGFFAFIIGNFNRLAGIVFESFSGLGLKAGGSALSGPALLQPGRVAQVGIDAGNPILEAASQLMGYVSFFENFVQIAVLMTAWAIVLIAFFILAVQIFVTLIEFKLTTLAGFVLIPFALFSRTAFLAEKVLGNIVASGVKILVLAVIVGIGSGLFGEFTRGFGAEQPTITDALSLVLGALSLMGLSIFGPGIATGLVSGAPQLGAGAAVGTSLAAAGLGVAGAMGARAGFGSAAGAVSAGGRMSAVAARGGAHLAGSTSTAFGLAAATSGQSGAGSIAAGLAGVARAGVGAAAQPVRQATSRAASALSSSQQAGRSAAWSATGGEQPSGAASGRTSGGEASAGSPPEWATRMKRGQAMSHGASTAAHSVRSGDHGGGSMNVSLSQDERR